MKLSYEDYIQAKWLLSDLNTRIDEAPSSAKPVFRGIVWLHDLVHKYEAEADRDRNHSDLACHGTCP